MKNPKEEPTMVDKLKEYFNNNTEEQIQKDWEEACRQTEGINSPTVDEFLEVQKQFSNQETLEQEMENRIRGINVDTGFKKESLEEVARVSFNLGYDKGTKYQAERMYSEEEVKQIANFGFNAGRRFELKAVDLDFTFEKWFEQFKKK